MSGQSGQAWPSSNALDQFVNLNPGTFPNLQKLTLDLSIVCDNSPCFNEIQWNRISEVVKPNPLRRVQVWPP